MERVHYDALTKDQHEFFLQNGYLVIENVLSAEECNSLLALFEQHADSDYSEIVNPHNRWPEILALMKRPRTVAIIETIQSAPVVGLQSMFVFKKAGTPQASQAWNVHQDVTYARAKYGLSVAGDYILGDHDNENGSFYVYPGSYVEPILEYDPVKSEGAQPGNKIW